MQFKPILPLPAAIITVFKINIIINNYNNNNTTLQLWCTKWTLLIAWE